MVNRPSSSSRPRAASTRAGARPATGSNSQQAILIGLGATAVIAVLLFMFNKKGEQPANAGTTSGAAPAAEKSAKPATAAPAGLPMASAKAGKTPTTAAPPLTAATLAKYKECLEKAKALSNDGVNARNAGDNTGARDKQAAANVELEAAHALVSDALAWQESAQLDDWAQPAEYVTLEKLYLEWSTLTKKVRMAGGK
jgi:hypothetical protein